MPTETDTIEALRNRLNRRLQEIDSERSELIEAIRVLGDTPRLLSGVPRKPLVESTTKTVGRTISNRNVTELVRQYIAGFEREKAIDVPTLVKSLQEQGVKGKYRSLYSACHVILRKEASKKDTLTYERGVGFYRPKRAAVDAKADDSVLVYRS